VSLTWWPVRRQHDRNGDGLPLVTLRYGLDIRAVTPAEAPGLSVLLAQAGLSISAPDLAERLPALRTTSGTALVALKWGPPSGLVVLHWYPSLRTIRPVAQISLLLVSVEERRQGIGRILVKAAAQAARSAGCGDLEIAAAPDAPSLREFCRATGFADAGARFARSLRRQG
jgi:aminoglycoside 6'-N-acetyltransferase I